MTVDLLDNTGNSPLHYAAKYGHQDLCRLLVGKNAFPGKRNDKGETPYDVSESHTVRQYLLPLQFQSERNPSGNGSTDTANNIDIASAQSTNANYSSSINQIQTPYSSFPSHNQSPIPHDIPSQLSPQMVHSNLTAHQYVSGAPLQHSSSTQYHGVPSSIFPDQAKIECQRVDENQSGHGQWQGCQVNPLDKNNVTAQNPIPLSNPAPSLLKKSNSITTITNAASNIVISPTATVSRSGSIILNQIPSTPQTSNTSTSTSSVSQPQKSINIIHTDYNAEKNTPSYSNQINLNRSTTSVVGTGFAPGGVHNNSDPISPITCPPVPVTGPPVQSVYRPMATATSSSNHRIIQPG